MVVEDHGARIHDHDTFGPNFATTWSELSQVIVPTAVHAHVKAMPRTDVCVLIIVTHPRHMHNQCNCNMDAVCACAALSQFHQLSACSGDAKAPRRW